MSSRAIRNLKTLDVTASGCHHHRDPLLPTPGRWPSKPCFSVLKEETVFLPLCRMPYFKETITREQGRSSTDMEQARGRLESVCKAVLIPGGY